MARIDELLHGSDIRNSVGGHSGGGDGSSGIGARGGHIFFERRVIVVSVGAGALLLTTSRGG